MNQKKMNWMMNQNQNLSLMMKMKMKMMTKKMTTKKMSHLNHCPPPFSPFSFYVKPKFLDVLPVAPVSLVSAVC